MLSIKKSSVFFAIFLTLLMAQSVLAQSSVWKVSRNGKVLYIGGTLHFLRGSDYPLPEDFEKAYIRSAVMVFETDIGKVKTSEFQKLLMSRVLFTDGRNLGSVLEEKTLLQLKDHLARRNVPIANLMMLKPGMVSLVLTGIELERLGNLVQGVDDYYYKRALDDGKKMGWLESIEQQVEFIARLGEGQEDELIRQTLKETKDLPETYERSVTAWRHGDNMKIAELFIKPLKTDFPDVYRMLISDRNMAWIRKIEDLIQTDEVEFVLVGTLHLAGEDGIISRLRARGFDIGKF